VQRVHGRLDPTGGLVRVVPLVVLPARRAGWAIRLAAPCADDVDALSDSSGASSG